MSMTPKMRPLIIATSVLMLSGCLSTDMTDLHEEVARIKRTTPGEKLDPPPKLEPYRPFAYAAYGLRNPFEEASFLQDIPAPVANSGVQPNLDRPRELLEAYSLESIKMVGTINKDGLWALMEAPDDVVHPITVGNYMGTNHGQVIGVSDQRIDLIEIVPDGLGGWEKRESFLTLAE